MLGEKVDSSATLTRKTPSPLVIFAVLTAVLGAGIGAGIGMKTV